MKRLCDELQERIAKRANAANQMVLAMYREILTVPDDQESLSYECLFNVTRNMLDPAWHLTLNYIAQSQQPILTRNKATFEFIFKPIALDIFKDFSIYQAGLSSITYLWVYTQGSHPPPIIDAPHINGVSTRNFIRKLLHDKNYVDWHRGNSDEYEAARKEFHKTIMDAVEVLVATS